MSDHGNAPGRTCAQGDGQMGPAATGGAGAAGGMGADGGSGQAGQGMAPGQQGQWGQGEAPQGYGQVMGAPAYGVPYPGMMAHGPAPMSYAMPPAPMAMGHGMHPPVPPPGYCMPQAPWPPQPWPYGWPPQGPPGYAPAQAAPQGAEHGGLAAGLHARGAGMAQLMEEIAGGNGLSSLVQMLNLDDKELWKGALLGAAVVLLLTNDSVQNALFKTGVRARDAVQSGVDKVKTRAREATGEAGEGGGDE